MSNVKADHIMARQGDYSIEMSEYLPSSSTELHHAVITGASEGNELEMSLPMAAKHGRIDIVRQWLQMLSKFDLNERDEEGYAAMHYAARSNHFQVMQLLIDNGADPNVTTKTGHSSLHYACTNWNVDAVEVLLQSPNIEVNIQNSVDQNTPLHEACLTGNCEIVEKLLCRMKQDQVDPPTQTHDDLFRQNCEKLTPLHVACKRRHFKIVSMILEFSSQLVNSEDNEANTPLDLACESVNNEDVVQLLLKHDASANTAISDEVTMLHIAARHGYINVALTLLKSEPALIKSVDVHHKTALHYAVEYGQPKMIEFLLGRGEETDAQDMDPQLPLLTPASDENGVILCYTKDVDGNTPLHIAADKGNLEALKVLLSANADMTVAKNNQGETPLHLATKGGHILVVQQLIIHQESKIDYGDANGDTPLHLACSHGHRKVAKVLVDAGAYVEARNVDYLRPMDYAVHGGWDHLVLLLIDAKAEIHYTSGSLQWTPLHWACHKGFVKIVEIFLKSEADVTKRDENGSNPLDIAIENGHENVAMAIIRSPEWKGALRNAKCKDESGRCTTPLRKLIARMPDVAEEVFSKCIETNATEDGRIGPHTPDYKVTYDFEFLEDFRDPEDKWSDYLTILVCFCCAAVDFCCSLVHGFSEDEYTTDWGPEGFEVSSHPLALMVEYGRTELLKHPLVKKCLHYKWSSYGRRYYFVNLFFYLIFLIFLTTFALVVLNPQTTICEAVFNGTFGNNTPSDSSGPDCSDELSDTKRRFLYADAVIVIIFALFRLGLEFFQLKQLKSKYILDWVNWIEVFIFVISIMFVWVFHTDCLCPKSWQWQLGTIALFLGWIDLIIFASKFPYVGIYVVMFGKILWIFLKVTILAVLLIVAFSLAFYMAFFEPQFTRTPFSTPGQSILKVMTMMTGEFDYEGIFHLMLGGDPENPEGIPFPPVSYMLWIVFLVFMPILLSNLLVGLAVDDIQGVQEAATLRNRALKVDLVLHFEKLVPKPWRRSIIKGKTEDKPNMKHEGLLYKYFGTKSKTALLAPIDEVKKTMSEQSKKIRTMTKQNEWMEKSISKQSEQIQRLEDLMKMITEEQSVSRSATD